MVTQGSISTATLENPFYDDTYTPSIIFSSYCIVWFCISLQNYSILLRLFSTEINYEVNYARGQQSK